MRAVVAFPARHAVAAITVLVACSDPPARVTLVPVRPTAGTCGAPAGATELRVIAYAGGGEVVRAVPLGAPLDIADFPGDTEQFGVELGIGGGIVGAAGKTAPFDFAALDDGTALSVLMAPPGGLCAVGAPVVPRVAPLLARAGDGVLVVGGVDGAGQPLASVERYDPATGRFTAVAVPEVLAEGGFVGAALVELADGRVALTGGLRAAITLYDPVTHTLGESLLVESRALHAAVAVDPAHLLLAGGCSAVEAGACSGVVRKSSKQYAVDDPSIVEAGPTLVAGRLGARLFDTGVQRDGGHAYVLAGGAPAPDAADATAADRLVLGGDATAVTGTHAQATVLDGGGVLTAFAAPGQPATGAASVVRPVLEPGGAPGAAATEIAAAPVQAGRRLVTLEDGRVVGLGGSTADLATFDPMLERWSVAAPAGGSDGAMVGDSPSLIRLADGSVLVLGGHAAGTPVPGAWIYRPSLLGPAAGAVTVVPGADGGLGLLTPVDPASVTRGEGWILGATGAFAPAVVGGPRASSGSVRAVVRARAGGVGLLARYRGTGDALLATLVPGEPARLVALEGAGSRTLCSGGVAGPFATAGPTTIELVIEGERARLLRDGATVVACAVGPGARGAWGVAALGPGGEVVVDTVTVAR